MNFIRHAVLTGTLLGSGCAIERIDQLLEEHGVTWEETMTGGSSGSQTHDSTSTSTGTGESGTEGSDTEASEGSMSDGAASSSGVADASSSTGSTGSTGVVGPVCGDGEVEGEETCDDMNDDDPDDGCTACARDSVVFISSTRFDGAINGLDGADQRCRMLAAIAGLSRFETFRAWLSTANTPAADRLLHSRGRYVLVNGLVVAQNWDGLVSGQLVNPIVVDEQSQTQDYVAWTGTLANGQPALGTEFCDDWTTDLGSKDGGNGLSGMTDATWSYFEDVDCSADLHLYCFEQ